MDPHAPRSLRSRLARRLPSPWVFFVLIMLGLPIAALWARRDGAAQPHRLAAQHGGEPVCRRTATPRPKLQRRRFRCSESPTPPPPPRPMAP